MAKVNVGPLEDEKGVLIMGNEEMAKALNKFFVLVFTVEDKNNVPKIDGRGTGSGVLKTITITKEVVLGRLMGLKVDKSPGPDGMHPRVLKEMAEVIAEVWKEVRIRWHMMHK